MNSLTSIPLESCCELVSHTWPQLTPTSTGQSCCRVSAGHRSVLPLIAQPLHSIVGRWQVCLRRQQTIGNRGRATHTKANMHSPECAETFCSFWLACTLIATPKLLPMHIPPAKPTRQARKYYVYRIVFIALDVPYYRLPHHILFSYSYCVLSHNRLGPLYYMPANLPQQELPLLLNTCP